MLRNLCSGCGAKFPWQWKAKRGLADGARSLLRNMVMIEVYSITKLDSEFYIQICL